MGKLLSKSNQKFDKKEEKKYRRFMKILVFGEKK